MSAADVLIDTLVEWNVDTVFGIPGDGINLLDALIDGDEPPLPPKISFEHVRHMVEALARGAPHAGRIADSWRARRRGT